MNFMIVYCTGVKSFNLDSKRGLKELERFGFLDATNPEEIAYFLFHEGRWVTKYSDLYPATIEHKIAINPIELNEIYILFSTDYLKNK